MWLLQIPISDAQLGWHPTNKSSSVVRKKAPHGSHAVACAFPHGKGGFSCTIIIYFNWFQSSSLGPKYPTWHAFERKNLMGFLLDCPHHWRQMCRFKVGVWSPERPGFNDTGSTQPWWPIKNGHLNHPKPRKGQFPLEPRQSKNGVQSQRISHKSPTIWWPGAKLECQDQVDVSWWGWLP